MTNASRHARELIFRAPWFQDEVAGRLELEEPLISRAIEAILAAGILPSSFHANSKALAVDAATMLLAIGTRQTRPESTCRVAKRLEAMRQQCEIGSQPELDEKADIFPQTDSTSFGSDLFVLFQNLWRAARGTTTKGFKGVSVSMLWNDDGSILFGLIEQNQRKRIYSSEALQIPAGGWDYIRLPAAGGTIFSPLIILRFGALLDAVVSDTAATLDGLEIPHAK